MGDARPTNLQAASKRSQATLTDFMDSLHHANAAGSPAPSDEPAPADDHEEPTT